MAAPSYTYTLTNGSTADASQVMQNYNDILNGVTDGTKDLSINALTCAGTATLNGDVNLGNASGDTLSITASLGSTIPVKTDDTYNIGSSTLRIATVFAHKYYGTKTNDAAGAGEIGEYIASTILEGSAVAFLTGAVTNITSIALTAGDWDVTLLCCFVTATSAVFTYCNPMISTSSTTDSGSSAYGTNSMLLSTTQAAPNGSTDTSHTLPAYRVSLSGSQTYYFNVQVGLTGTCKAYGRLTARRVR